MLKKDLINKLIQSNATSILAAKYDPENKYECIYFGKALARCNFTNDSPNYVLLHGKPLIEFLDKDLFFIYEEL